MASLPAEGSPPRPQTPPTHYLYLLILAVVLAVASFIGSVVVENEGHRAIWRNTEHTSEMMSSLFADQTQEAIDKLHLVFDMIKDEPKLVSALLAGNRKVLGERSDEIAARSRGLVAGFSYFAADGRTMFESHAGDSLDRTKAVVAAVSSGQVAHSLEIHSDNDVHVHLAGAVRHQGKVVAHLNLVTTLNQRLDEINRLLRLETEQHAAVGHRGDSAIGVFLTAGGVGGKIRPAVTTESFPRHEIAFVTKLIADQATQGETQNHQFSLAPL
ncbi:MAG TPA: hypothetical protein VFH22_14665, partial [Rhodocyclaceae bacterium]|nr:hypothetical protein [Rhodocyclaceae bacterium]